MTCVVHTDGSCYPNPGPGSWAAIIDTGKRVIEMSGFESETTNNRMELMGPLAVLERLRAPWELTIYSDSQYVVYGASKWMARWHRKGWRKIANADLWIRLHAMCEIHAVTWRWVRGHNGDPMNERADKLAGRIRLENTTAEPTNAPDKQLRED